MTTGAPRDNARLVVAELIGTMFLVMAVVGSGIMAERLAGGLVALAPRIAGEVGDVERERGPEAHHRRHPRQEEADGEGLRAAEGARAAEDRKSTRLNSSHRT